MLRPIPLPLPAEGPSCSPCPGATSTFPCSRDGWRRTFCSAPRPSSSAWRRRRLKSSSSPGTRFRCRDGWCLDKERWETERRIVTDVTYCRCKRVYLARMWWFDGCPRVCGEFQKEARVDDWCDPRRALCVLMRVFFVHRVGSPFFCGCRLLQPNRPADESRLFPACWFIFTT